MSFFISTVHSWLETKLSSPQVASGQKRYRFNSMVDYEMKIQSGASFGSFTILPKGGGSVADDDVLPSMAFAQISYELRFQIMGGRVNDTEMMTNIQNVVQKVDALFVDIDFRRKLPRGNAPILASPVQNRP